MARSCNYWWYGKQAMLPVLFWCTIFISVLSTKVAAQTCTGSLGDPVVHIDFGRGSNFFGPPLGKNTNYSYIASGSPLDGFYTIAKSVVRSEVWYDVQNHTPNDPDGYLMFIAASYQPGIFYETDVSRDLCPNTTYEFAAWVSNVLTFSGIKPNLTFMILSMDDQILKTYNTGEIPESSRPTWKQYGFLFATSGNVTKVKIRIINNAPGGTGNDLALDDITFRACGPNITVTMDNAGQMEKTICENENTPINISAQVTGVANLQYLWQSDSGSGWIDLNNEISRQMTIPAQSLPSGFYQYRMVAAASANFSSQACRTASPVLTLHVKPSPKPVVASPQVVCLGNSIKLEVNGTEGTYLWTGPNGYRSAERSAVLPNADVGMSGMYMVTVSSGGCSSQAELNVKVVPAPVAAVGPDVSICEGDLVRLNASGGLSYKWTPAAGLSATDIADPEASPTITTLYRVSVSNGGCEDTAHVSVRVFKRAGADAGKDRAIIEGEGIVLEGKVQGDSVRYFWTPSDYLDNPAKLRPVAKPLKTITYTLNAMSVAGCAGASSSVTIKVYPRLEIPNTFSPNGDGINDVWNIIALEAYPEATISVYNRYGELTFSSTANIKSWDGKCESRDAPVGTYYYVINLHNGQNALSGSIMVLR